MYRKYAGMISLLLGLLSVTACLISMVRDWLGLALFGFVVGLISLWISRDIRKQVARSDGNGENEKRLFSSGLFSGNSRFSPILIFVLVFALGCMLALIFFMKNFFK
jgi:uncharacterized oligopeptide transporter (OPT) family protein